MANELSTTKQNGGILVLLHLWLSCIGAASRTRLLSSHRRQKLNRSALKRARRLIEGLDSLYPGSGAMMPGMAVALPMESRAAFELAAGTAVAEVGAPLDRNASVEVTAPGVGHPVETITHDLNPVEAQTAS